MASRLLHHELYYMAYSHALDAWSQGRVPRRRVPVGTQVLRSVPRSYGVHLATAVGARTVTRLDSENRWTGARPVKTGRPGTGGLYLSLHFHALQREVLHYGVMDLTAARRGRHAHTQQGRGGGRVHPALGHVPRTDERAISATKRIFLFVTIAPIETVDFSLTSDQGRMFIRELGNKDEIRKALEKAGYGSAEEAYTSGSDHSFDRGLGHALHDRSPQGSPLDGLIVSTVRDAESPSPGTSENLVLFNAEWVPDHRLRACQEFVFYGDSSTTYYYDQHERVVDKSCRS